MTLIFDVSRSSKVKSDGANQKLMTTFTKVLPPVQHRICHRFQDISNQRIVTLTYNLNLVGTLYIIISVGSNILNVAVFDIFHVKTHDLDFFTPEGHARSNLTVQIKSQSVLHNI